MKKYVIMLMMLFSFGCNVQKDLSIERDLNNKVEQKENVVSNAKVIEYDTIRYFVNDTIYQPIKKITYINQEIKKESKEEETLKEEESKEESTKSEFGNYLIAFSVGSGLMLLLIIIIKLIIFYFKYRKL